MGLFDRLKQHVTKWFGGAEPAPEPVYAGPPRSLGDAMARIQEAGRRRVILRALYHNNWRDLEPYSYRYRAKVDPHVPLLFAWCRKDNQIEAFKLQKFADLQVTMKPYDERWVVEF